MDGEKEQWFGADPDWAQDDNDESNSGENDGWGDDDDTTVFGAQHVLIMIDCNPSMFERCVAVRTSEDDDVDEDDEMDEGGDGGGVAAASAVAAETDLVTPFDAALRASEELLRLRVRRVATTRAGKRDGVGVFLYGCRRRKVTLMDRGGGGNDVQESFEALDRRSSGNESDSSNDPDSSDEEEEDDDGLGEEYSSTYDLIPVAPPGKEQVLRVRGCLPYGLDGRIAKDGGGRRERDLENEFADRVEEGEGEEANGGPSDAAQAMGHSTLCPLRQALQEATKSFLNAKCVKTKAASSKYPADSKTLWIFTNQDDPCRGSEEEKKHTAIVAKDAAENGLKIHVWDLPRPMHESDGDDPAAFDRSLFYDSITTRDDYDENVDALDQPSSSRVSGGGAVFDLEEMLERFKRQMSKPRKALSLPLLLPGWERRSDDPGIWMDFYRVVQIQKKPLAVTINQQTNKATIKCTQIISENGAVVAKESVRTYSEFGGERVLVSRNEVAEMKKASNASESTASLILLGFQPAESMKIEHTLDKSYFVYPNDGLVKGSRATFAALRSSMIRRGVLALGELLPRATASSRLVAMVPTEDIPELPGFFVYQLPYEDDARGVDNDCDDEADETTVDAAVALIRNQKLYNVDLKSDFENPALRSFWTYIESVSLAKPLPDDFEDATEVDTEAILESARDKIEALNLCLPDDVEVIKARKRKAAALQPDDSGVDWVHLYETDALSECNAETLKKYLRSVGAKLGGKKAELVQRVKEHLKSSASSKPIASGGRIVKEEEVEEL